MNKTVEESMLEHYKFIISIKSNELAQLYNDVEYRERELSQLRDTLDDMTILLSHE
jgi:hypothetical protein